MKIEKLHVYLGCLALILGALWFFEGRWNEDKAVAEVKFVAYTNKEMYLKMKLDEICRRYKMYYPCPNARMNDQDRADYEQYDRWYKEQQKQIKAMFQNS